MEPDHFPQRDGSHSDVIIDDRHHQCPRTEFEHGREFDEEALQRRATQLVCTLNGRSQNKARFPAAEVLERCQALKEELDLAIVFLSGARAMDGAEESNGQKLMGAFERGLRFMWMDGDARPKDLVLRLAAYTWTFFPNITGASSQTALLRFLGVKDKQQFHRHVSECREAFKYFNPLMRGEQAVENMRASMRARQEAHGSK